MKERPPPPAIGFLKRYIPGVLDGTKTATCRKLVKGKIVGPYYPGDIVSATCQYRPFAALEIVSIEAIHPEDMTLEDAISFGSTNIAEGVRNLRAFYPDAKIVQVIRFKRVRPIAYETT